MAFPAFLKPSSTIGKFLFLGLLIAIVYSIYNGHFELLEAYLARDEFTFKAGAYTINLYSIFSGLLLALTSFWITAIASSFIEGRILDIRSMRNSSRVLIAKIVQITLYTIACLIVLKNYWYRLNSFLNFRRSYRDRSRLWFTKNGIKLYKWNHSFI